MNAQEDFLGRVFGFFLGKQKSVGKVNQVSGVSIKQNFKGGPVPRLKPSHQGFVGISFDIAARMVFHC
jgi:hypothetical protein